MAAEIRIFNSSSLRFLPKKKVTEAVKRVLKEENINTASINIIFLDDNEIREMNNKFLRHDYPTDVISFNFDEDELTGEIYIGAETAKRQANEYNVSLTNEIKRLSVHGALHLIGYDDASDEERLKMRELENKYIKE